MKEESWWEEGSEEDSSEAVSPFADPEAPAKSEQGSDGEEPDAPNPTLSGEVGMMDLGQSSVFGDTKASEERSSLPKGAWFAIGLIGAPMLIAMISIIFGVLAETSYVDGWHSEDTNIFTKAEDTIEIDGKEYNVYYAKFGDIGKLGEENDWNFHVQWGDDEDIWGDGTYCNDLGREIHNGTTWRVLGCYNRGYITEDLDFVDGDSDVAAGFVRWTGKVDGAQPDAFTILSNESDVPRYAEAYGDEGGTNGLSDFFGMMAFLVWPLGALGIAFWGFTKGNSAVAWGVLSSIIVVPLVFFGLCILLIVAFTGGFY